MVSKTPYNFSYTGTKPNTIDLTLFDAVGYPPKIIGFCDYNTDTGG